MYSSDLIEEVVSRNDIVDVISGYIKLKKNGSSYVGLCFSFTEQAVVSLFWMWSWWQCNNICYGI